MTTQLQKRMREAGRTRVGLGRLVRFSLRRQAAEIVIESV
jgi:hypothetical protein